MPAESIKFFQEEQFAIFSPGTQAQFLQKFRKCFFDQTLKRLKHIWSKKPLFFNVDVIFIFNT